jgi:hypothetical protein
MEKKEVLKNAMSELSAFDAKIKRLVIIEELKITNECYRNWIKGINVPSRKKREALNVIFGKPIYIN